MASVANLKDQHHNVMMDFVKVKHTFLHFDVTLPHQDVSSELRRQQSEPAPQVRVSGMVCNLHDCKRQDIGAVSTVESLGAEELSRNSSEISLASVGSDRGFCREETEQPWAMISPSAPVIQHNPTINAVTVSSQDPDWPASSSSNLVVAPKTSSAIGEVCSWMPPTSALFTMPQQPQTWIQSPMVSWHSAANEKNIIGKGKSSQPKGIHGGRPPDEPKPTDRPMVGELIFGGTTVRSLQKRRTCSSCGNAQSVNFKFCQHCGA